MNRLLQSRTSVWILVGMLGGCGSGVGATGDSFGGGDETGEGVESNASSYERGQVPTGELPAKCFRRGDGTSAVKVRVRVDEYKGVKRGRNGWHEMFNGTIVATEWAQEFAAVDTTNAFVAMNVSSPRDKDGLPQELVLAPGEELVLQGSLISSATSKKKVRGRPAVVVHFTHSPCGYVERAGTRYR